MTSFIMSPCFLHQLLRQHGSAFSYYTSMTFWEAEISWFSIITSDKLLSLPELQLPRASHHSWTIVLCCITMGTPSEKRIVRWFSGCEHQSAPHNVGSTAYHTPRLHGTASCSWPEAWIARYCTKHEIKTGTRNNHVIKRHGKHEMYKAAAGVTWQFYSKLFYIGESKHSKITISSRAF